MSHSGAFYYVIKSMERPAEGGGAPRASLAMGEQVQAEARELLGDTYQAAAAMMVKIGETDAAWIAADRAGFCAE